MEKIDATMRLLLLGTLLVAWVVFAVEADPVQIGVRLYQLAKSIPEVKRSVEVKEFLQKAESGSRIDSAAAGIQERVQDLSVMDCYSLRFARLPLNSEEAKKSQAALQELILEAAKGDKRSYETAGNQLGNFLLSDPFGFRDLAISLVQLHRKAGVTNDITLGELKRKVEPEIKMPFVEVQIGAHSATKVIAAGLLGLMLYLLSLLSVVERRLCGKAKNPEGGEWIFFHPSRLGSILGVLWIATPALVLSGGGFLHAESRSLYFVVGVVLLFAAGFVIARALTLRQVWKKQSS